MRERWSNYGAGIRLALAIVLVLALLGLAVDKAAAGTTSQSAFERCGKTHLTVRNNSSEPVDVIMFGKYAHLAVNGTQVFWTDEDVVVDRVTRRRSGQAYHTSTTSVFGTEQRACTSEWATL